MKWIKFCEQMPELGTLCLCRSGHAETMSDYTVAEFRGYPEWGGKYHEWCDSDSFCWLGEDYCYHTEEIAEYWVPLFELDKELRHEVD